MFNRADKDGSGSLTKEEWHAVLNSSGCKTPMKEVEDFFDEMDRDFDGRLSFEVRYGKVHPCTRCNLVHFINFEKKGTGRKELCL